MIFPDAQAMTPEHSLLLTNNNATIAVVPRTTAVSMSSNIMIARSDSYATGGGFDTNVTYEPRGGSFCLS